MININVRLFKKTLFCGVGILIGDKLQSDRFPSADKTKVFETAQHSANCHGFLKRHGWKEGKKE